MSQTAGTGSVSMQCLSDLSDDLPLPWDKGIGKYPCFSFESTGVEAKLET